MKLFLNGVLTCCREREDSSSKRLFVWKENGRSYKLECKINEAGRYILCSIVDQAGKKHKLFFQEGKSMVRGWAILTEKLKELGVEDVHVEKQRQTRRGRKTEDAIWIDVGENLPRADLGTLNYGMVGS